MGLFDKKKNNTEKQEKQTEKTNQKSYQPLGCLYRHKIFVKRNIQTEMDVSGK